MGTAQVRDVPVRHRVVIRVHRHVAIPGRPLLTLFLQWIPMPFLLGPHLFLPINLLQWYIRDPDRPGVGRGLHFLCNPL
jgi:hypothetical protein